MPRPNAVDSLISAQKQTIDAALRCVIVDRAPDTANSDADTEYAHDLLGLAARDLYLAIEKLPPNARPVGWGK